jgi:hypothetical protein
MNKLLTLLIFCLFLADCKNSKEMNLPENQIVQKSYFNDYIDFEYDKVIAFASVQPMDYYGDDFDKKIDLAKFTDTISKTLNSTQIQDLNTILSGRKNNDADQIAVADCFYPRHNVLFLNKGKTVTHISVCFECNIIKSNKKPLTNMKNLEDFFNSLGLKVFNNPYEHLQYYKSLKINNENKLH